MGCDIHSYVEIQYDSAVWTFAGDVIPLDDWARNYFKKELGPSPFDWRHYGMYAFLADVRNYSAIEPISQPRGIPSDISPEVARERERWEYDGHSGSWLLVSELLAVDYEQIINDRRVSREIKPGFWSGKVTGEPEEGERQPLREFLGKSYFADLDVLASLGNPEHTRVVFWFDN